MTNIGAIRTRVCLKCETLLRRIVKRCCYTNSSRASGPPWKVLFFGSNEFSLRSLEVLYDMSISDKPLVSYLRVVSGKDVRWQENEVMRFAKQRNIFFGPWPPSIQHNEFDIGVVVSFGHLIPLRIIKCFPLGMLNVHGSLLPRWRGACPVEHALLNGDQTTGITLMKIKPHKFDVGEIVSQEKYDITPIAACPQVTADLAVLGSRMLRECFEDLPSRLQNSQRQPDTGIALAPKVTAHYADVRWWEKSAVEVYNQWRAISHSFPLQIHWQYLKNPLLKLHDAVIPWDKSTQGLNSFIPDSKPGQVFYHKPRQMLCIRCSDAWLGFLKVQPAGSRIVTASEFRNGVLSKHRRELWYLDKVESDR